MADRGVPNAVFPYDGVLTLAPYFRRSISNPHHYHSRVKLLASWPFVDSWQWAGSAVSVYTGMNPLKLRSYELDAAIVDVTSANVALDIRVRRGRMWNPSKWRDDVDTTSATSPRPRLTGTVVGFTDAQARLIGETSRRQFDTDRITETSGTGWAVVEWDSPSSSHLGARSVYPIGAAGVYSLVFAYAGQTSG